MAIQTLYRVQCNRCERYLGDGTLPFSDSRDAALFISFTSAYQEALERGWTTFPLWCQDCWADND